MGVTRGVPDLAATINAGALEGAAVRSGDGSKLTLPLILQNLGNLLIQKDQFVSVRLYAVAEGSETETEIAVIPGLKVGGMKSNATKTFNLKITLPVDLTSGAYQLRAEVDSDHELTELGDAGNENGANNTAAGPNVNMTRFGSDLTLAFGDTIDLPGEVVSGDGKPLSVPLVLTNSGNDAVPRGQKITIKIYAHDQADGASEADDVLVYELSDVSIAGLAAGTSKTFNLTVTLPAGVGPGNIVLVAKADSADVLAELNESNNSAATGPLGNAARAVRWVELR